MSEPTESQASGSDQITIPLEKFSKQGKAVLALAGVNVPSEPAPAKSNVVACRIDKRDLDAIDALIEAGIRSTRSDAAAWLIHAGIVSHKALFEKVYGTVTEIRRLRMGVQQLVQETEQLEADTLETRKEQNTASATKSNTLDQEQAS